MSKVLTEISLRDGRLFVSRDGQEVRLPAAVGAAMRIPGLARAYLQPDELAVFERFSGVFGGAEGVIVREVS